MRGSREEQREGARLSQQQQSNFSMPQTIHPRQSSQEPRSLENNPSSKRCLHLQSGLTHYNQSLAADQETSLLNQQAYHEQRQHTQQMQDLIAGSFYAQRNPLASSDQQKMEGKFSPSERQLGSNVPIITTNSKYEGLPNELSASEQFQQTRDRLYQQNSEQYQEYQLERLARLTSQSTRPLRNSKSPKSPPQRSFACEQSLPAHQLSARVSQQLIDPSHHRFNQRVVLRSSHEPTNRPSAERQALHQGHTLPALRRSTSNSPIVGDDTSSYR
mmetsp:Transcript_12506/g.21042  ORF Transcript_12506/g.21042 Transcript_12506/m.21042 type:complete len:273 (-) Transcript_12506:399-1217(-)